MFLWVFTILIQIGHAQSLQPGDFDIHDGQAVYSGQIKRADRAWKKLKDDLYADVLPGTNIYSMPDNVYVNRDRQPGFNQCTVKDGTRAKVLGVYDGLAIVRILSAEACPPTFNVEFPRDPYLAFVPTSKLKNFAAASTRPVGELLVAAVAKPICGLVRAPLAIVDGMIMHPALASDGAKTDEQLDAYFSCYKTKNHDDYQNHLKKAIDLTGPVFSISVAYENGHEVVRPAIDGKGFASEEVMGRAPISVSARSKVLKCLIYRESGWDAAAHNPASHAAGLGQQTSIDAKAVTCLIAGCMQPVRGGSDRFKPPQPWAQAVWKEYFRRAHATMSAEEWNWATTNRVTHKRCLNVMAEKDRDANCPLASIAATALDQVAIELAVREAYKKKTGRDGDFDLAELHELILVDAAALDAGITRAANAAKESGDIFAWARYLVAHKDPARHKELKNYFEDLEKCLDNGDARAMNGTKDNKSPQCLNAVANAG